MSAHFFPTIVDVPGEKLLLVGLAVLNCGHCSRLMLRCGHGAAQDGIRILGKSRLWENRLDQQIKGTGIKFQSRLSHNGVPICTDCEGLVTLMFRCSHCDVTRHRDMHHLAIGPTEEPAHLCRVCYDTIPASRWDEIVRKLVAKHTSAGAY